jgi:hypothetical protein
MGNTSYSCNEERKRQMAMVENEGVERKSPFIGRSAKGKKVHVPQEPHC